LLTQQTFASLVRQKTCEMAQEELICKRAHRTRHIVLEIHTEASGVGAVSASRGFQVAELLLGIFRTGRSQMKTL
jgi:hypothetical protein